MADGCDEEWWRRWRRWRRQRRWRVPTVTYLDDDLISPLECRLERVNPSRVTAAEDLAARAHLSEEIFQQRLHRAHELDESPQLRACLLDFLIVLENLPSDGDDGRERIHGAPPAQCTGLAPPPFLLFSPIFPTHRGGGVGRAKIVEQRLSRHMAHGGPSYIPGYMYL